MVLFFYLKSETSVDALPAAAAVAIKRVDAPSRCGTAAVWTRDDDTGSFRRQQRVFAAAAADTAWYIVCI